MKKVLVTGATGFVGSKALPLLANRFDEVHAVSRRAEGEAGGVRWRRADLLDERESAALIETVRPTHLLHLAWFVEPGTFWTSDENSRWVEASTALARRFADCGGQRLVAAGTCAEYDWMAGGVCSERRTPLAPSSAYGAAKHALHAELEQIAGKGGLAVGWGRIFFLFGPGEHPDRLVSSVIRRLLSGERAPTTEGSQVRDFLRRGRRRRVRVAARQRREGCRQHRFRAADFRPGGRPVDRRAIVASGPPRLRCPTNSGQRAAASRRRRRPPGERSPVGTAFHARVGPRSNHRVVEVAGLGRLPVTSVSRNVAFNFLGKSWAALMSLAFVPLYIRFLGIEAYGLLGFFSLLLVVLSVLDLGLGSTLNRELARHTARQDGPTNESRDLLRTLEVPYGIVGILLGVSVAALAPFLARHWVNAASLPVATVREAIILMGVVVAAQWPTTLYAGGLRGLQQQGLWNAISASAATLRGVGAALVLWKLSATILAFFTWQAAVSILQTYCRRAGEGQRRG
jgi:hypothetical protein